MMRVLRIKLAPCQSAFAEIVAHTGRSVVLQQGLQLAQQQLFSNLHVLLVDLFRFSSCAFSRTLAFLSFLARWNIFINYHTFHTVGASGKRLWHRRLCRRRWHAAASLRGGVAFTFGMILPMMISPSFTEAPMRMIPFFIEVFGRFFRNVGISGVSSSSPSLVSRTSSLFGNVDRREEILTHHFFADYDGIFKVVAFPWHEGTFSYASASSLSLTAYPSVKKSPFFTRWPSYGSFC